MKSIPFFTLTALLAAPAVAAEKDWMFGDGHMPERWSLRNSEYALCDAGLMQSPIDLGAAKAVGDISVSTNYGETAGKLKLATQKLQVDLPQGQMMMSAGKQFNLLQVHFHTPSEHAIDGQRMPLVAHFVHATKAGELGVLGVMYVEGKENAGLAPIVAAMGKGDGAALKLDTAAMIPDDLSVFRYMGSLTTPPCSEGVNWHVAGVTVEASAEQIATIRGSLGLSARSVQELGNRLLVAPGE